MTCTLPVSLHTFVTVLEFAQKSVLMVAARIGAKGHTLFLSLCPFWMHLKFD